MFVGHENLGHGLLYTSDDDGCIKQICAKTHRKLKNLRSLHREPIYATCSSHDGKFFATSDSEGRIVLYDGQTGEVAHDFGVRHEGQIDVMAFDKSGHFFFTGGADGQLKKWSAYKKKLVKDYQKAHGDANVTALVTTKDVLFSADTVGGIKAWNVHDREDRSEAGKYRIEYLASLYQHPRGISAIAISNNCEFLFTADEGGYLKQWDITDILKGNIELVKNYGQVFYESVTGIVATPDHNFVYLSSERGTIKKIDILKMECVDTHLRVMECSISSIALSLNGDRMWIVDEQGSLKLWETAKDPTEFETKKIHYNTRLNTMAYLRNE